MKLLKLVEEGAHKVAWYRPSGRREGGRRTGGGALSRTKPPRAYSPGE